MMSSDKARLANTTRLPQQIDVTSEIPSLSNEKDDTIKSDDIIEPNQNQLNICDKSNKQYDVVMNDDFKLIDIKDIRKNIKSALDDYKNQIMEIMSEYSQKIFFEIKAIEDIYNEAEEILDYIVTEKEINSNLKNNIINMVEQLREELNYPVELGKEPEIDDSLGN